MFEAVFRLALWEEFLFPALALPVLYALMRHGLAPLSNTPYHSSKDLPTLSMIGMGSIFGYIAGKSVSPIADTLLTSLFGLLGALCLYLVQGERRESGEQMIPVVHLFVLSSFFMLLVGLETSQRTKEEAFCMDLYADGSFPDKRLLALEQLCSSHFPRFYILAAPPG